MTSPAPSINVETVESKYKVLNDQEVGRGTWSVVKRCIPIYPYYPTDVKEGTRFVVKIMDKQHLASMANGDMKRVITEVYRELKVLKHIPKHPNIVQFIEYFETEEYFFLIFEESLAGDLCELILQVSANGYFKSDEGSAKNFLYQLIKAVVHCHCYDVTHRDLKPENCLLSDKDSSVLRLTDFGMAKISKNAAMASTQLPKLDPLDPEYIISPYGSLNKKICECSDVIGTHRYGAPETFYAKMMKKTYDGFLSDTWAVGIVGFIILTGSFPFSTEPGGNDKDMYKVIMDTSLMFPSHVSPLAQSLIKGLLCKDSTNRLRLSDALNHPWFESIYSNENPSSYVVQKIKDEYDFFSRESFSKNEVIRMLNDFSQEVTALHTAIQKFRGDAVCKQLEITALKDAHEEDKKAAVTAAAASSIPSPSTTARIRQTRGVTPRAITATSMSRVPRTSSSYRSISSSTTRIHPPSLSERKLQHPAGSTLDGIMLSQRAGVSTRSMSPLTSSIRKTPSSSTLNNVTSSYRSSTPIGAKHIKSGLSSNRLAPPSTTVCSPLTRTAPSTVRRGTPATAQRTATPMGTRNKILGGTTMSSLLGSRPMTPLHNARMASSTPIRGADGTTPRVPLSISTAPKKFLGSTLSGGGGGGGVARTPNGILTNGALSSAEASLGSSTSNLRNGNGVTGTCGATPTSVIYRVGETVSYHGLKAVVHFSGVTDFGVGNWLGIEMLEGTAGMNDGVSSVDRKRYFTCPKGRGLFVRPGQVVKTTGV